MKKTILNLGKTLSKKKQKSIQGGMPEIDLTPRCVGTGTGGVSSVGFSSACIGRSGKCTINGYQAACTGNGGGFWFY